MHASKIFPAVIFCPAVISVMFLFSCSRNHSATGSDLQPTTVKTVTVQMQNIQNEFSSFGTVTYKTKHDVSALVAGSVSRLLVKEGDYVTQEQKLAELRNVQMEIQKEQYENTLASAQASLSVAKAKMREERLSVESRILSLEKQELSIKQKQMEYDDAINTLSKKKQLHDIGGLTDAAYTSEELSVSAQATSISVAKKELEISELGLRDCDILAAGKEIPSSEKNRKELLIELNTQSVAAEIDSAQATVRNAEKSLLSMNRLIDELTIKATVSGIIGACNFEKGEYVAENKAIFTIMDTSSVYAVFYIQEQDIGKYGTGTPVEIELPSLNETRKVTISEISPVADPQSGNFSVKALLINPGRRIKPGMFIKSSIKQTDKNLYPVIPETALVTTPKDGSVFVYAVVNGYAVIKHVTIKSKDNGNVWIATGLSKEDRIIDKPSPFLREGASVNIL